MTDRSREARAERAARRRATLEGRLTTLAEASDPPVGATIEERLRMTKELSDRAWALSGRPRPDYDRANIPFRRLPDIPVE